MVKFGFGVTFYNHAWVQPLFGREMATIQPPTHTADPIPFFGAEVFHMLFLTTLNY